VGLCRRSSPNRGSPEVLPLPQNCPVADASWLKITPQAIHWAMCLAHDCFGVKQIFITENGCGYRDTLDIHCEIHDLHRRELLWAYLRELKRAIDLGIPVGAYFLRSYLDNFEWEDGHDMRFGAVYCDFETQKRTPKLCAKWYSEVVRSNRIV
jgi:beta-glucosidase